MVEDFKASKPTPVTCLLQQGHNFESFPNSSTDEGQAFKHMSHSHSNQTWGGRWKKQGCSYGYRVECQRRKGLGRSAETPAAAPWPHQCPEAHHHWSLFSVQGKKTLILSSSLRKDAIHHNRERHDGKDHAADVHKASTAKNERNDESFWIEMYDIGAHFVPCTNQCVP